jgi:hypothetical protein
MTLPGVETRAPIPSEQRNRLQSVWIPVMELSNDTSQMKPLRVGFSGTVLCVERARGMATQRPDSSSMVTKQRS